MPSAKYTGNPMGSGNPPGESSDSYLSDSGMSAEHFVDKASYRGDMNVGRPESPEMVGNQPTQESTRDFSSSVGNPAIPGAPGKSE